MGPKDMVTVLTCLCFDPDEKIKASAEKSLIEVPERILLGAVKEDLHPMVLDHLARVLPENEGVFEAILINKQTPDETFAFLADRVSSRLLEIIGNNQVRILRHPPIATSILKNPKVLKSTVEMMMDFAVRTGMNFQGVESFEEAKKRILSAPSDPKEEERIQQVVIDSLPQEMLTEEKEPATPEEKREQEAKQEGVLKRLHTMTAAQKVALAQKGNKTIRMSLVRDSNKVVAVAAIKNPGTSESEVTAIVSSRSVCDDVLRIICNNREWTRSYAVKLALVNNPKTPLAFSMRFLQSLNPNDLKALTSNKNIPSALATAAKQLTSKRTR
jgi:hypothetical protein